MSGNSRLRVALDMRLTAYRRGGISRYATDLHRALHGTRDLDVVPVRSRRDSMATSSDYVVRTPPHHRLERFGIAAEILLSARTPDIYHATDFVAPRIPGVQNVATVHDLAFLEAPEYLQRDSLAYYSRLEQSKRWTAAWITPSHWTANCLIDHYGVNEQCVHIVPHGVSSIFMNGVRRDREAREDFLLAVGTVEPRKRYDLLLDAFERLPDAPRLFVVGSPGWRSEATERRLMKSRYVTWYRELGDGDLCELYCAARAVVITSQTEGFGLPALEAMASGTPVISSNHGALPEVTGSIAVAPHDDSPRGWANAIERIQIDDALWERLSQAGYDRAKQFTWKRAAELTAVVYRSVAQM